MLSFDSRFRGLVNVSVSTSFEILSPVPETTPLPAPLLPPLSPTQLMQSFHIRVEEMAAVRVGWIGGISAKLEGVLDTS